MNLIQEDDFQILFETAKNALPHVRQSQEKLMNTFPDLFINRHAAQNELFELNKGLGHSQEVKDFNLAEGLTAFSMHTTLGGVSGVGYTFEGLAVGLTTEALNYAGFMEFITKKIIVNTDIETYARKLSSFVKYTIGDVVLEKRGDKPNSIIIHKGEQTREFGKNADLADINQWVQQE
jgi:hypothetical protein